MANNLNPTERKDLQDVISIYGNPISQTIPTNMLGPALRAMKLNPLDKEVINFVTEFDKGGSGSLSVQQLIMIYNRKKQDSDSVDQLLNAFKFLDKDHTGYISVQEFKYYMCKMGESITEIDVDDILRAADVDFSEKIDINRFARILLGIKS